MFEYTKCDGIMIARGALGNPWIFKEILGCEKYTPSNEEKLNVILRHIDYAVQYEYEKIACFKMRKHIDWYLKGMKGSAKYRDKINTLTDISEVKEVIKEIFNYK